MEFNHINAEERFRAFSSGVIQQLGISLTTGTDFDEFVRHLAEARPDHTIGDPFNPMFHDMSKDNAAWVIGRDRDGHIMHTQALRLLPTGSGSVAEYFRTNFRGFSPPDTEIDFDRSRYRPGPCARQIRGRVVYSGETWMGGQRGQFRGSGLSSILGRFALMHALSTLQADYVVGFMIQPVAHKGFSMRAGFLHAEPLALQWYMQQTPDPVETFMVYMSAADIRFLLELPTPDVVAQAA